MMQTNRWKRRLAVLLAGGFVAVAAPPLSPPAPIVQASTELGAGGEIFPITPQRIMDSRVPAKDVSPFGRKPTSPAGSKFSVPVTDFLDGVAQEHVLGVLVNVVIINPSRPGVLAARPTDSPATETSLVNFLAGSVVPNLGIVGVAADGSIEIDIDTASGNGEADVLVDLYGWIANSDYDDTADIGSRVVSVTPERVLDTRAESAILQGSIDVGRLKPLEIVELPVRSIGPVPNSSDVTGVVVNLTGVNAQGGTYLSLSPQRPTEGVEPPTSTGNYIPGPPRANMAVVPINENGSIFIQNGLAELDALVDVIGYLRKGDDSSTQTGRVVPLSNPFRSFDTRLAEFGSVRLGPTQWEDWSFTKFAESVQIGSSGGSESPIPQQGLFGNLVAFSLQNAPLSYFTINPREPEAFSGEPPNSTLNFPRDVVVGNMTLAKYGTDGSGDDKMLSAFNRTGSAHYHLDVYAVILD